MKAKPESRGLDRGVSLVETMVSIGVLAVVAPLAMAALIKAGEGGSSARAETRAPVIVEACIAEIRTAREGNSDLLPALTAGQPFGTGGDTLALAFRRDGTLLGQVASGGYETGTERIGTETVSYLARLQGDLDASRTGFPEMLHITITVEFPAVAPADKRRGLEFHTKLP